ncbi:MAG: TetR/AcrR family transcriptional regulator [Pseudomonadota bacterium]
MQNSETDRALNTINAYLDVLKRERPSVKLSENRSSRGAQTVADLLAAAHVVFVRDGYAGLSFRTVAREAGVAVGNVSYYFANKTELVVATLHEAMAGYVEAQFLRMTDRNRSPLEILLDVVEFYVEDSHHAHPLFFQMWGYLGSSDEAKEIIRELYRPIGKFVYYLVKAANPALSYAEARRIVFQIFSLEQGMKLFITMGPEKDIALQSAGASMREATKRLVMNA